MKECKCDICGKEFDHDNLEGLFDVCNNCINTIRP
jgi:hypothetical protein